MPTYEYSCAECGRSVDEFRQVDQRHDAPVCHGKPMFIVLCPTFVQADIAPYQSPASGKWITSRRERRDDLARTNSRPWEGMESERKEATKRKKEAEAKADAKLEHAIRKSYHELPPSKRRVLEGGA